MFAALRKPRLRRPPILVGLAALGFLGAIAFVMKGRTTPPVAQPVSPPAIAPYGSYIAGSGMIEASTRNIAISTPVGGVAIEVAVKVGDRVAKGQDLFRIDARDLDAQRAARAAGAAAAHAQIPEAQAVLDQARNELERAESLPDRRALSAEDLANRRYAVQLDAAKLATARANAASADAQVAETEADLERLIVRAPMDGEILQVNLRPGEYAQTGVLSSPLILMGDTRVLHVRTDIDQNDAWRLRPGTPAKAFLRGNSAISFDLHFAYVEPYVVPKQELTGQSTEQVDTRVLQVVYAFAQSDLPVYVGQQVDVYIAAPPGATGGGQAAPPLPAAAAP
ncbi:MAG TPA: efflux RND transporter periplasmic adaptor subunit, partial [Stellaceae bacterium]|nr:efflux RND transporter periplasmic adaptor subunit [Stellaceae bacterium]